MFTCLYLVTRHGVAQTEFYLELPQPPQEKGVDSASGSAPPVPNGRLTRQDAIERAMEYLAHPAPEATGVSDPRNPVAWHMTLGDYFERTGQTSSLNPDFPVWVVHMMGESQSAGIVPPEARQTYRYAVVVLDARKGSVMATQRMNEPLVWPTVTHAPTMSDPKRPGPKAPPQPTPAKGHQQTKGPHHEHS